MNDNRVVITGLGAVTPVGIGVSEFFDGLKAGRNGISRVSSFDVTDFRSKLAAEVKNFDAETWIDRKSARRMDRFTQFGIAATAMAIEDAGLESLQFDKNRSGVSIGSGIGGSRAIEEGYATLQNSGPDRISPFIVSRMLINMAACMVSIRYGLKGPLSAPSVACSTGSNAIGDAFRILQRGDAKIMIAGSSEACVTPLPWGTFCATRSMTANDCVDTASRPFDRNRDGFVMGEGGAVLILEDLEHAIRRDAKIYCEMFGYGLSGEAYHITALEETGLNVIRCIKNCLREGGISLDKVDYINAHGTSTPLNDIVESNAIKKCFSGSTDKINVSSTKSMTGHCLGAAGAIEAAASVLAIKDGTVPPTINLDNLDEKCAHLNYTPNVSVKRDINVAISNSMGFGGHNVTLGFKKYEE